MERVLGFHTAPPAGVPALEPDIRGAVVVLDFEKGVTLLP